MKKKDKIWVKLLVSTCSILITGIVLFAIWNVSLLKEIKKSEIERKQLKNDVEKVEILAKVNSNFIKDVLRQKAITLCFLELIEKYEEEYSRKEKEDCIQLIVMADEKYGHKGLDAPLLLAWLEKESAGNPKAVSYAGAKGLTQWMDYRAWKILKAIGYPGYDTKLIFNPVVSLAGGLYHLEGLMNFWEWKGTRNQSLILFYAIHSYKWGSENTEELFNTERRANRPAIEYVNWILNRREYWAEKLKYWIDDAQKLTEGVLEEGSHDQ